MSGRLGATVERTPTGFRTILERVGLRTLLSVFPFVFALHELEEWNVLAWHRRYQTGVPVEMTDADLRVFFVAASVLAVAVSLLILRLRSDRLVSHLMLPLLTLNFYNGIVHLAWSLRFRSYAPGLVFGFGVGAPLTALVVYLLLTRRLVKPWVLGTFAAVSVLLIADALAIGDALDPRIVSGMRVGHAMAGWLGL